MAPLRMAAHRLPEIPPLLGTLTLYPLGFGSHVERYRAEVPVHCLSETHPAYPGLTRTELGIVSPHTAKEGLIMPINSRIRLDVELDGLTFGDLYEFVDLGRAGGVDPDTEVELTSTDPDDPRADGFGADVPLPDAVVVNLDSHRGPGAGQDDGDVDEESAQDEEQAVDEEPAQDEEQAVDEEPAQDEEQAADEEPAPPRIRRARAGGGRSTSAA
jgi:hypothetical protein